MYQSRIQNKKNRSGRYQKKRDLEYPNEEDGTYFGVVKDMLGNGRVRVFCEDSQLRIGRIRGSMRKSRGKTIIERNDLVIIAPRDFEDKLDIIYKYTAEEISGLISKNMLPDKIYKNLTENDFCKTDGGEDMVVFCEKTTEDNSSESDDETSNHEFLPIHKSKEDEEEDLDIDAI